MGILMFPETMTEHSALAEAGVEESRLEVVSARRFAADEVQIRAYRLTRREDPAQAQAAADPSVAEKMLQERTNL